LRRRTTRLAVNSWTLALGIVIAGADISYHAAGGM
jgi:hypothetical protein